MKRLDTGRSGRGRRPAGPHEQHWAIGIDTGGTFTDAVAVRADGQVRVAKARSTPSRPEDAFGAVLDDLAGQGVAPGIVTLLVHGTTLATNAVLQRRLARVALITTDGFRDVLAIGTGRRRDVYDLWAEKPAPLVPREDTIEVRARTDPAGRDVLALTDTELVRVATATARRSPESVAVSLLFSYADGEHERRVAAAIRAAVPGIPVTVSCEIVPEHREYPRTATTVIAAGLGPVAGDGLPELEREARRHGIDAPLLVMLSNGGSASATRAAAEPHHLVLSGPAAGVAWATAVGARLGESDLISLDMGGTSTDVCLIRGGVPPTTTEQQIDGLPLLAPAVDVVTVGAGGGSIAELTAGGGLRVGPRSAGAEPGPAAYGRGGAEPTVTDAHLVIGDLDPGRPLAGRISLDAGAAGEAVGRIGAALGLGAPEAAAAILAVTRAHLARAIRRVSVERGVDPRGMTLVAFGGAGPMHAAALLRELGLGAAVVPPHAGLGSAAGLLAADLRVDASRSILARLDRAPARDLLAWLRSTAASLGRRLRADGVTDAPRLVATVDCRYVGQGFELPVPLPGLDAASIAGLTPAFHALHHRTYGHHAADEPVEAVTLRLSAFAPLPAPVPASGGAGTTGRNRRTGVPEPTGTRPVRLPGSTAARSIPIYDRDTLRPGDRLAGPCIVVELDSTALVLDGMAARVADGGELVIRAAA